MILYGCACYSHTYNEVVTNFVDVILCRAQLLSAFVLLALNISQTATLFVGSY
jgi:hypothetical protein